MPKKIVILTTGQPSTNPRMVKEYTALKSAGFEVKVFYSYWQKWACHADGVWFAGGELNKEDFVMVGGSPSGNKWLYTVSKVRQKINQVIYRKTGKRLVGAISRVTPYLISAAKSERADLYIAHNVGALPAAVIGANKFGAKAAFDAEDYHRGEFKYLEDKASLHLVAIEDIYLPKCTYVTAASPLIASAYQGLYPTSVFTVILNVFSKCYLQEIRHHSNEYLTMFWFSQTVGPNRGLETVVKALNLLDKSYKVELYLMGNIVHGFDQLLLSLSDTKCIHFLPPVIPDEVFSVASRFDIGLSLERPDFKNRDVCLTNKIFTYILAGNCIIYSDTKAQVEFLEKYPDTGFMFEAGNEQQLSAIIKNLFDDRNELIAAKEASLRLADKELNWENESVKFINLINQTLK